MEEVLAVFPQGGCIYLLAFDSESARTEGFMAGQRVALVT